MTGKKIDIYQKIAIVTAVFGAILICWFFING